MQITTLNPTPPECNNSFSGVDHTIPLYVPKGSVLKYKAANDWRDFVIIREISDGDNIIYLTINDGGHGCTKLKVDEEKPYVTLKMEADNGWQLYAVTLNDENIMSEVVADGSYTTPAISTNSTLNIIYVQAGTSVRTMSAPHLSFKIQDGSILIAGTKGGECIKVYTLDGKCKEVLSATANLTKITVAPNRTYIIKVNSETFKIAL